MIRRQTLPGVEVREISTIPPAIAPVSTAIPAFIGFTEDQSGERIGDVYVRRITSFTEYEEAFGGAFAETYNVTIKDTLVSNGSGGFTTEVANREVAISDSAGNTNGGINPKFNLYYSLQSFFNNGGSACYIVSIGTYETTATAALFSDGLKVLNEFDEPTLIVSPDSSTNLSESDLQAYIQAALLNASSIQDRFVVADVPGTIENVFGATDSVNSFREGVAALPEVARYGSLYYPSLNTTMPVSFTGESVTITHQFLDADGTEIDSMVTAGITNLVTYTNLEHIENGDINDLLTTPASPALFASVSVLLAAERVTIPSSGAVVGAYSFIDLNQGVFRAPANVPLNGVISPNILLTDADHSELNVPVSGNGRAVNAIRSFTGRGNLIFGARTLDGNSNEWRYINVRRLFIFIEESIQNAMESFVFQPNTGQTWLQIRGTIENFLTNQWRIGALAGAQPADAFFVRVGLGETMTADDINNGILNVEIGLAPSRPAEFIVLQFSQTQQIS